MKKDKGITLVALVVTIVVLLILAGISLNLVLGQNGIISKAKEAREKTDEATTNTELFFNSTVDEIDKAIGDKKTSTEKVSDEEFRKNPTNYKHEDQKDSNDVGIGTDGKPVNLDLWHYEELWDGSLCLGVLDMSYISGAGYDDYNITEDGTIEGTVPRIIYLAKYDKVAMVTSMYGTFYNCKSLVIAPEIPDTVTTIYGAFRNCTGLKKAPVIPSNVNNIEWAFDGCTGLEEAPIIPDGIGNLFGTFSNCTSLVKVNDIPDSVMYMERTFINCTSLKETPKLSNNISNLSSTFSGCSNLTKVTIPENVTSLGGTFSNCTSLTIAPVLPKNLKYMDGAFSGCTSLITAPEIPDSVTVMRETFLGCTSLTGTITINATLDSTYRYYKDNCFSGTVQPIVLKGSSPNLAELAATAENGNVTVEQ